VIGTQIDSAMNELQARLKIAAVPENWTVG
jgi:hypothetical protein